MEVKERKKRSKDASGSDVITLMRKRYERAVDAEKDQREEAIGDFEFLTVPGAQWDAHMRKSRKGRPCYEFSILRSHWRQVVNDQKKARPTIKVRAVENGDADGAELRQGLTRNIEQTSNADTAYDTAFETMSAAGFGAWLVATKYSSDDAWDQDLCIKRIDDPLNSVWVDPDNPDDPGFGFIEETMSRDEFEARYPKAEAVSFESAKSWGGSGWFGRDEIRVVAYYRKEPHEKTILLLSDGRSVDAEEVKDTLDELAEQGIEVQKSRVCKGHKVIMSICSGAEEIDGPHETVFHRVPIVTLYANRQKFRGKWQYCGMVRFSRDPQRLVNYNLTSAMEAVGKTPKSPYLVTTKMLEGPGVKAYWQNAAAEDPFFLPYTPDQSAPGGRPIRENPADIPAAMLQLAATSVDMLKATDGIYDASLGAKSNETSGKAILARQQEGDTATYDYQDALSKAIQITGDIILRALPKVYDTPRMIRVIGKDGAEDVKHLYKEELDRQTGRMVKINDLSAGKYDVTVSTGPNYDTMRMEFVDAMTQLGQGNPLVAQAIPDLIVKALDVPWAEEAAERIKMVLPPQIQQQLSQGKEMPPEVQQALQQAEMMMQQAQQGMEMLQQASAQVEQEKAATESAKQQIAAEKSLLEANYKRIQAEIRAEKLEASADAAVRQNDLDERDETLIEDEQKVEQESGAMLAAQTLVAQATDMLAQQSMMMEKMGQMLAAASAPKRVVRDETGRVVGIAPVEQVNGVI